MKTAYGIILALIILLASCKGSKSASPAWVVSTLAGSTKGYQEGAAADAQFDGPQGVAVDSSGNVYVADTNNHRIRKIAKEGGTWTVDTIAGDGTAGHRDDEDNTATTTARFDRPTGVAVDSSGNVYVADRNNTRIRMITEDGEDANGNKIWKVKTIGAAAQFSDPIDVDVDSSGNVYVANSNSHRIRKIAKEGGTWTVSTLAGSGRGYQEGAAATAQFTWPTDVAVDTSGNVYVTDQENNRIRKIEITPGEGQEEDTVEVSTLAGSGTAGYQDGAAAAAQFSSLAGVDVDKSDNVYVADSGNHRIRKITGEEDDAGNKTWTVSTLAGSGTAGYQDGATAQFHTPDGVAVDESGNVYVADTSNHRIRKIEYRVP